MWDRGAQSEREMQGSREKEDSRVGGLTVDCNNRTHEGVLQSEAPFSAQRWYASGAVFMQLRKRGHPVVPVRMVEMQAREAEDATRIRLQYMYRYTSNDDGVYQK